MNCYFSDLKLHRGSWLLSRHTHQHTYFSQSDDSSCPASFALKQLPQELLYWNFLCVFPSLISDHTHLFSVTGSRCLLALTQSSTPPHPSTPHVFCTALRRVCCEANEQESWANFRDGCWNPTKGAPTSEFYNRNLTACSHEEYHSFSPADACCELML